MKTNPLTKQELDDLMHPEHCITKLDRFKFWFTNLDIRIAESVGKTKRICTKIKEKFINKNK